jgi:hypothetical protein
MYSTTAYIYQQVTRVLMMDASSGSTFPYRYDPVYAKRLTVNLGVDNVLLFEFVNQDQKPFNITGSELTFRMVNQSGTALLAEKTMTILNATAGRARVTLTAQDLVELTAQPASYSITRTSGVLTEAVFVDAQAGARAPVDIVNSVQPVSLPSRELTIPTTRGVSQVNYGAASPGDYPDWSLQGTYSGGYSLNPYQNLEYYSSFIEPAGPVTTIQMDLVGYTGTVKTQAAETYQSIWYNVTESVSYLDYTGTIHITVVGWHPLLRLAFNNSIFSSLDQPAQPAQATVQATEGVITSITVTNPGLGYMAPPLISIVGTGAGAVARAHLGSQGSVSSIEVVSGGSGYRPSPPTMNPAVAIITTGFVTNLLYR